MKWLVRGVWTWVLGDWWWEALLSPQTILYFYIIYMIKLWDGKLIFCAKQFWWIVLWKLHRHHKNFLLLQKFSNAMMINLWEVIVIFIYILIRLYLKYYFPPRPPSRFIYIFFLSFIFTLFFLLTIHRDIPLVFHNRIKSGFEEEKHVLLEMISLTCRDKLTILCLTTIHKRSYDRCDSTIWGYKLFNWTKL